jgi:tetratricopeptide (TPR) repeat protein
VTTSGKVNMRNPLRVLMQTRSNVFTQRGGDTVVLERTSAGLTKLGVEVVVDPSGTVEPRGFDLVHLFNFATPTITGPQAQRALTAGVPYVVTTLYEDTPQFHTQSHYIAVKLIEYVRKGQTRDSWSMTYRELGSITPSGRFAVDAIALNAAALLPNGLGEAKALTRDFPNSKLITPVMVGSEIGVTEGPELFRETYGVSDFVLCVGRLESRKNQLMLLKALEDSEIPVVLAAGGFSYQPEYDQAVRTFVRKGKTLVLGSLDPRMLASAYAACRIHVLPSWYELPGLVSLEAAAQNKNIVVTRTGTTADYVGSTAFYCLPWDSDSVRSAVLAAYYAPAQPGLVEMATSYSWEKSVRSTLEVYGSVVKRKDWLSDESNDTTRRCSTSVSHGEYDMSLDATQFLDLLERGEAAAKNAEFELANEWLCKAESMEPNSTRVLRARGAVLLAQSNPDDAAAIFERGLRIEPDDAKLLAGRGMCDLMRQKPTTALSYFERALAISPDYLVALHQLLECSYGMCQYDSALAALTRYLALKPDDSDIRFCYAGCLFKSGQAEAAEKQLEMVLKVEPSHVGARELGNIIRAGIDGRDSQAAPKPAVEATPHLTPGVAVDELRSSLAELSDRIKSWRVPTAVTQATEPRMEPQDVPLQQRPESGGIAPASLEVSGQSHAEEAEFGTALGQIEDLKRAGDFKAAAKELASFLQRPNIPNPYRETARCLEAEFVVLGGDLLKASQMYEEVLKENPRAARALCGKGAIAAELSTWTVAEEYFKRALQADSECDVAYAGLGLCAMVANQIEKAFDLFATATEKNPENNRALLGVLQTGYPLKRYTEMERMLVAFLDLHPANLDILYSFAGVLFAQGKVKEARLEIEKILIFEPQHEHALELKQMIEQSSSATKTAEIPN